MHSSTPPWGPRQPSQSTCRVVPRPLPIPGLVLARQAARHTRQGASMPNYLSSSNSSSSRRSSFLRCRPMLLRLGEEGERGEREGEGEGEGEGEVQEEEPVKVTRARAATGGSRVQCGRRSIPATTTTHNHNHHHHHPLLLHLLLLFHNTHHARWAALLPRTAAARRGRITTRGETRSTLALPNPPSPRLPCPPR